MTTAALFKGSVGAGSAFARPARDASVDELVSLCPSAGGWQARAGRLRVIKGTAALAGGRAGRSLPAMGFFRFRRTIPLGKFFRINVSKTGASLSAGRPGATVNVRKDRVDATVGVPGSGLSYKERLSNRGCASLLLLVAFAAATLALLAR